MSEPSVTTNGQSRPLAGVPPHSNTLDLHVHHSPVPEVVLGAVPAGTHVLVMTHDHAERACI